MRYLVIWYHYHTVHPKHFLCIVLQCKPELQRCLEEPGQRKGAKTQGKQGGRKGKFIAFKQQTIGITLSNTGLHNLNYIK